MYRSNSSYENLFEDSLFWQLYTKNHMNRLIGKNLFISDTGMKISSILLHLTHPSVHFNQVTVHPLWDPFAELYLYLVPMLRQKPTLMANLHWFIATILPRLLSHLLGQDYNDGALHLFDFPPFLRQLQAEATAAQSHGEGYDTLSHSRTMYRLPPESLVELTLQLLSPASDALLTLTAQIVKPI